MQHKGKEVQIIQPFGCPCNGTMGMTYVQLVTGEFIGSYPSLRWSRPASGLLYETSLPRPGISFTNRREHDEPHRG